MAPTDDMVEQTPKYRAARLELWQLLHKKRDEYVSAARQHGASDEAAHAAAARHIRGDVRVFVDELLIHLRELHAGQLVKAAPREWGVRTELLLDVDPLIPNYITQSFPVAAWTVQLDAAEREAVALALAARDADWTPWLARRLDRLGDVGANAAEHVFGAVGAVGQGVGEAIGGVGQGLGEGLGGVGRGVGDALKIATGVASVGAVIIGGIWLLRRS